MEICLTTLGTDNFIRSDIILIKHVLQSLEVKGFNLDLNGETEVIVVISLGNAFQRLTMRKKVGIAKTVCFRNG